MTWLLPIRRHADGRPWGYWKAYHAANLLARRAYLAKKAREYRARRNSC